MQTACLSAYKNSTVILKVVVIMFLIMTVFDASAQRIRKSKNNSFIEHYNVLKSDTSILHGDYKLFFKTTLIETGNYINGVKSGVWTFFNLGGIFEFQYDFDRDSILKIAGENYYRRLNERPSLYLGSPLVPYVFISEKVGYPLEAIENNVVGKVVLTLKISEKGEIIDRYISESLNAMMDSTVLDASLLFPDYWEWLPAKNSGVPVESLYNITIYFELH